MSWHNVTGYHRALAYQQIASYATLKYSMQYGVLPSSESRNNRAFSHALKLQRPALLNVLHKIRGQSQQCVKMSHNLMKMCHRQVSLIQTEAVQLQGSMLPERVQPHQATQHQLHH